MTFESVTKKIRVDGIDFYLVIGKEPDGRVVFIDLVADRSARDESGLVIAEKESGRPQLETICRMASALLASKVWNLESLIEEWVGTHFRPFGKCDQLEDEIARSPIDAAAKVLRSKASKWRLR